MYEKITQSQLLLGDDEETEQSPDPKEEDRGLFGGDFLWEKVDHEEQGEYRGERMPMSR